MGTHALTEAFHRAAHLVEHVVVEVGDLGDKPGVEDDLGALVIGNHAAAQEVGQGLGIGAHAHAARLVARHQVVVVVGVPAREGGAIQARVAVLGREVGGLPLHDLGCAEGARVGHVEDRVLGLVPHGPQLDGLAAHLEGLARTVVHAVEQRRVGVGDGGGVDGAPALERPTQARKVGLDGQGHVLAHVIVEHGRVAGAAGVAHATAVGGVLPGGAVGVQGHVGVGAGPECGEGHGPLVGADLRDGELGLPRRQRAHPEVLRADLLAARAGRLAQPARKDPLATRVREAQRQRIGVTGITVLGARIGELVAHVALVQAVVQRDTRLGVGMHVVDGLVHIGLEGAVEAGQVGYHAAVGRAHDPVGREGGGAEDLEGARVGHHAVQVVADLHVGVVVPSEQDHAVVGHELQIVGFCIGAGGDILRVAHARERALGAGIEGHLVILGAPGGDQGDHLALGVGHVGHPAAVAVVGGEVGAVAVVVDVGLGAGGHHPAGKTVAAALVVAIGQLRGSAEGHGHVSHGAHGVGRAGLQADDVGDGRPVGVQHGAAAGHPVELARRIHAVAVLGGREAVEDVAATREGLAARQAYGGAGLHVLLDAGRTVGHPAGVGVHTGHAAAVGVEVELEEVAVPDGVERHDVAVHAAKVHELGAVVVNRAARAGWAR